jgi:hypothetical protein
MLGLDMKSRKGTSMSQRAVTSLSSILALGTALVVLSFAGTSTAEAAAKDFVVYKAAGPKAANIQKAVDGYRKALGDLNPNEPGSFKKGRREINWDGVPDDRSDPFLFPGNFFNGPAAPLARGVVFTTPSKRLLVSTDDDNPSKRQVEYGGINPTYPREFATFSPQRLFTALGPKNIVEVHFFIPGSKTRATTTGFGAVFTDVDLGNKTSLAYYDRWGKLLHKQWVPAWPGKASLSFAGVAFKQAVVWKVRITSGTIGLGPNDDPKKGKDVVVMDDFLYGEPR